MSHEFAARWNNMVMYKFGVYLEMRNVPMKRRTLMRNALGT